MYIELHNGWDIMMSDYLTRVGHSVKCESSKMLRFYTE